MGVQQRGGGGGGGGGVEGGLGIGSFPSVPSYLQDDHAVSHHLAGGMAGALKGSGGSFGLRHRNDSHSEGLSDLDGDHNPGVILNVFDV
mmetsp:Transcript_35323/g.86718  ORF Transcript_35323/g.86718 Transcript_35323/m.86718 type:complete len:89 (+) Transcript_35323:1-267(+)